MTMTYKPFLLYSFLTLSLSLGSLYAMEQELEIPEGWQHILQEAEQPPAYSPSGAGSPAVEKPEKAPWATFEELTEEHLLDRFNACDLAGMFGQSLNTAPQYVKDGIRIACERVPSFRIRHPHAFKAVGGSVDTPADRSPYLTVKLPDTVANWICQSVGTGGRSLVTMLPESYRNGLKTICCNPSRYPETAKTFATKHPHAAAAMGCKVRSNVQPEIAS
jgi:hypothetical protein